MRIRLLAVLNRAAPKQNLDQGLEVLVPFQAQAQQVMKAESARRLSLQEEQEQVLAFHLRGRTSVQVQGKFLGQEPQVIKLDPV
jgi:hypothetical protein